MRTPVNQGYGGNQKLGYRYAIDNGFDIVALIHGDGQYAPEKLPALLEPFYQGDADAVFGSRMINKQDALKGGMPVYKWVGNQVLTQFQNALLGSHLSEFHSGYRLYSTKALARIPFERNSNDFHFDTDIIVQLHFAGMRIVEIPIPTFYGDEICHVNGMKYAWDIFRTMLRAKFHEKNLLYDRKFDVGQVELTYDLKMGFPSSHTFAVDAVKPGAKVLDIGCGQGYVAKEMAAKAAQVTGIDQYVPTEMPADNVQLKQWDLDVHHFPVEVAEFDQIFMLDVIEHLLDPEAFMEMLREATGRKRPEIVLTTANIGVLSSRASCSSLGTSITGAKAFLDRTHTRLFTFNSLKELFEQTGYTVRPRWCSKACPRRFPKSLGDNWLGRLPRDAEILFLIKISKGLFSYQIFLRAQALPTVPALLRETIERSDEMRKAATTTVGV